MEPLAHLIVICSLEYIEGSQTKQQSV